MINLKRKKRREKRKLFSLYSCANRTNKCVREKKKHDDFSKPWQQKLDATAHETKEETKNKNNNTRNVCNRNGKSFYLPR